MLRDLRTPAGLLLMVNFSLAVAMLTSAFAVNETSRREALNAIPPPGRDMFSVQRLHGKQRINAWPITAADLAAIRQLDQVIGAFVLQWAEATAKHGRAHMFCPFLAADHLLCSREQVMHNRPPSEGWHLVSGRWFTEAEVANAAQVCILEKGAADQLGIRQAGVMLRLNGFPFQVIGIRHELSSNVSFMPMTAGARFGATEFSLTILTRDNRKLMEQRLNPRLQQIFRTKDRFALAGSFKKEFAIPVYSRQFKAFLTKSSVGLAPIGIALFGAIGISAAWARERRWSYALHRALGATRLRVGLAALVGPLLVASLSSALGLGLGWLICVGLAKYLAAEIAFYWLWFVVAWAVGFTAMLPAALYVLLRAAYVDPGEALRIH